MAKWVTASEIQPLKNGNYLIRYLRPKGIYHRSEYKDGLWFNRHGRYIGYNQSIEWWDEYGFLESKKVMKLDFSKPKTNGQI